MTEKKFYEMVREEAAKSFAQRYPNTELTLREVTKNNGAKVKQFFQCTVRSFFR